MKLTELHESLYGDIPITSNDEWRQPTEVHLVGTAKATTYPKSEIEHAIYAILQSITPDTDLTFLDTAESSEPQLAYFTAWMILPPTYDAWVRHNVSTDDDLKKLLPLLQKRLQQPQQVKVTLTDIKLER